MSISEKRKTQRKHLRHSGWIASRETETIQKCMISDISDSGARLDVENAGDLPDEFVLLLTRNAKTRRTCRIVWRSRSQVGVHFDRPQRAAR